MSKRLCTSLLTLPPREPHLRPQQCHLLALRPTRHRRPVHHATTIPSRRPFTTSPHLAAATVYRSPTSRRASQPSVTLQKASQQQEAARSGAMWAHLGVLPGTFIMPTGTNLPSFWSAPRKRFYLEYRRIKNLVVESVVAEWHRRYQIRPRPDLERRKVAGVARGLYERMYTAFAAGDLEPVGGVLAPGIANSLRARIAARAAGKGIAWRLEKVLSRPRCVSFRFQLKHTGAAFREEQGGLVQAVVRLHTRQSLVKTKEVLKNRVLEAVVVDEGGEAVPPREVEAHRARHAKESVEYLVIQRVVHRSRLGAWQVWGTAEESTWEKMVKDDKALVDQEAMYKAQQLKKARN